VDIQRYFPQKPFEKDSSHSKYMCDNSLSLSSNRHYQLQTCKSGWVPVKAITSPTSCFLSSSENNLEPLQWWCFPRILRSQGMCAGAKLHQTLCSFTRLPAKLYSFSLKWYPNRLSSLLVLLPFLIIAVLLIAFISKDLILSQTKLWKHQLISYSNFINFACITFGCVLCKLYVWVGLPFH
jgi:hypothetical protein